MGGRWPRSSRPAGSAATSRPCVDVDTNPKNPVIGDRSFGDDPELVGRLGAAHDPRACRRAGVAACAKHFPGHGDTDVDSHLELPVGRPLALAAATTSSCGRSGTAIEAGVATIMTAHVLVRELDDARAGDALAARSSTGCCARSWATTASS